jgi:hypothetical protein
MTRLGRRERALGNAVVPPKRWPESKWRAIEALLDARTPDVELREKIRKAVALYVEAPRLTSELYLDPDGERPVPAAEVRALARQLAETARGAADLGMHIVIPLGKDTVLVRLLVRHLLSDDPAVPSDLARWPIAPVRLALLAQRAEDFAARYRDRPGRTPDFALVELVWRLTAIIECRLGLRAATLSWREDRSGRRTTTRAGEYSGRLFELGLQIQPLLPPSPGSIAGCSASTLGARLIAARERGRRLRPRSSGEQ